MFEKVRNYIRNLGRKKLRLEINGEACGKINQPQKKKRKKIKPRPKDLHKTCLGQFKVPGNLTHKIIEAFFVHFRREQ